MGLWLCPGKNNREGPSEGPQLPTPHPHHNTHAYSEYRGPQYLSSKSMFQQSQKKLSCSRVFCITRKCKFKLISLMDSFLIYKGFPPPQERPHHAGGCGYPPKMHYKRETPCVNKGCNIAISGTFCNSNGLQLISTGLPLLHSI